MVVIDKKCNKKPKLLGFFLEQSVHSGVVIDDAPATDKA
jgi:hypothetical protein